MSAGGIAGAVVGSVVGAVILVGICCCFFMGGFALGKKKAEAAGPSDEFGRHEDSEATDTSHRTEDVQMEDVTHAAERHTTTA